MKHEQPARAHVQVDSELRLTVAARGVAASAQLTPQAARAVADSLREFAGRIEQPRSVRGGKRGRKPCNIV